MMSRFGYDFSDLPDASVPEFYRQGQECLAGTIQLAVAADQRAATLTGIFGAVVVALVGAVGAEIVGDGTYWPLAYGGATAALLFFVAAGFCAWSARPTDFFIGGYEPARLISAAVNPTTMLRQASADVQVRIDHNRLALERAANQFKCGVILALLAPILSILVFIGAAICLDQRPF